MTHQRVILADPDPRYAPYGWANPPPVRIAGPGMTYTLCIPSLSLAATATDFFVIAAGASKLIRLERLRISGSATAAAMITIDGIKRTALNSGGTSTAQGGFTANHNVTNITTTATAITYTANPASLGAGNRVARRANWFIPAVGTPALNDELVWDWGPPWGEEVVLRGDSPNVERFALNFGGAAVPAGLSLNLWLTYAEEALPPA